MQLNFLSSYLNKGLKKYIYNSYKFLKIAILSKLDVAAPPPSFYNLIFNIFLNHP